MTVSRARASLLPVSSCLWAQQWEALGERVCLWQHWLLNTVWLMVQAAVSLPAGYSRLTRQWKFFFLSLFTLPQSHGQGEGEVNHRRAARHSVGVVTPEERNTRSHDCVACFLTWKSQDFLKKTFFHRQSLSFLQSALYFAVVYALFASLCFCVVFTCCVQVTVTHNGDSVASEK